MKQVLPIVLCMALFACSKSSVIPDDDPGGNNSGGNTAVSGKLKRIIYSYAGQRKADIVSFEYDATDRLQKYYIRTEDSTVNPIRVENSSHITFYYNGISERPARSSIKETPTSSVSDSTLYFYDVSNRLIREEWYSSGSGQVVLKHEYSYPAANVVLNNVYERFTPGSGFTLSAHDSLIYDAQNRIVRNASYRNPSGTIGYVQEYTYDNKINPLSTINVFKNVFTLFLEDHSYYFRSANNLSTFKLTEGGRLAYSRTDNYQYSSNNYPISATGSFLDTSPTPAVTVNTTTKFEYY